MQEAEEQDTCRICSAPAEPDQPLFYPCKCSGTIRYIHQDCLTTWLSHSKKKTCDVCKHPYLFTKVYAPDMPARLPPVLLLRRLAQQSFFALLFGMRAVTVALVWLAVLPWVTVWTWRMYFTMGDSTAWWLSDRPRPTSNSSASVWSYQNITSTDVSTPPSDKPLLAQLISHPAWIALSSDIFAGQIIAALIVLTFVAVFLLREWISQNARPGIFEDEEGAPEDRHAAPREQQVQPPPLVAPQPQPQPQPQPIALVQPLPQQIDEIVGHHMGGEERAPETPVGQFPDNNRHGLGLSQGEESDNTEEIESDLPTPARTRRRLFVGPDAELLSDVGGSGTQKRFQSTRTDISKAAQRRRHNARRRDAPEKDISRPTFEFSFKPPTSLNDRSETSSESLFSTAHGSEPNISRVSVLDEAMTPGTHVKGTSPLSTFAAVSPTTFDLSNPPTGGKASSSTTISSLPHIRIPHRPPLPSTTLPVAEGSPMPTPGSLVSRPRIAALPPLASPSLATYRAPEELEAGPSRFSSYFDQGSATPESLELDEEDTFQDKIKAEHGVYFQDPDEAEQQANITERDGFLDERTSEFESEDETEEDEVVELREEDDDDEEQDIDEDIQFVEGAEDQQLVHPEGALVDGNGQQEAQAQPLPGDGPAQPDANDELEGNVEDDLEGVMEAIGMRGPVYGVIQNAALMIFVLDTAIGLGVWLPFTIGKSTALLSLDPHRFLQILHFPIKAMRIITDPVVDSVVFLMFHFVGPWLWRLLRMMSNLLLSSGMYLIAKAFGQKAADECVKSFVWVYFRFNALDQQWVKDLIWSSRPKSAARSEETDSFFTRRVLVPIAQLAEPYFASLGREVRLGTATFEATWMRLALGQGATERTFAIILGYVVVGMLLSVYLNILTVGNVKSAGKAVRNAVRQQLLTVKVAAFIVIELAVFPLGCGVVLDFCTVWLFPEASILSRSLFFFQAPLTAMFYHWVAGTMFMYSFAVLLAGCRGIMRPGAMWFIKDPQDQNSHPIRDILDRPTLTQLRKILVSAFMYAFVVACVVGSVTGLLLLGKRSIMPLRWKNREPLSHVPIDLLFLHLVLPYTMHYFRPAKGLRKVAVELWKHLAAELRLTSYMFGGRHPTEEFTITHWSWSQLFSKRTMTDVDHVHDGTFRRVPATDNIALPRDMRATAEVGPDGEPVDDAARQLIESQDAEATKAKRVVKDDYTIVYIPPQFRWRVISFIMLLWCAGAVLIALAIAAPIQVGRSFFKLFLDREVHDGYSLLLGFYLLWACYVAGKAVDRMDKRRQRRGLDGPRADLWFYAVKRSLLWLAKICYMIIFLGLLIPILISLVMELYLVLPLRYAANPNTTPRIRVVDMWCLGILYSKIALQAVRLPRPGRVALGLRAIMNNGWTHPDPISATTEVIVPVTGGLLGMILFPISAFRALEYVVPLSVDDRFLFMHVYPGIFAVAGFCRTIIVLLGLLSTWSQAIRDKEFLVEMRLRNLEPEKERREKVTIAGKDMEENASEMSVD